MRKNALAASCSVLIALAISLLVPSVGGAAVAEGANPVGTAITPIGPLGLPSLSAVTSIKAGIMSASIAPTVFAAQTLAAPIINAPAAAAQPAGVDQAAANTVAAAASLPVSSSRDNLISFMNTVADQASAGNMGQVYDAARRHTAASEDASADETAPAGVPAAAAALHKKYDKTAAARLAAFDAEVKKLKSGRYGLSIRWGLNQGKLQVASNYTINGEVVEESRIDAKVQAGELPKAEWETARERLAAGKRGLIKKLVAVIQKNEKEHQAVHQQMDEIAKGIILESVRENLAKGQDLQSWGLPISISVDRETALRYVRLYRLNGMPTDLGDALHDLLAPLVAADPRFLSGVTDVQLHEAVQALSDSLKYSLNTNSPDGQKRVRLGKMNGGYDYPEVRQSLVAFARNKLTSPALPGDKLAGLGAVASEQHPSVVLMKILKDTVAEFQSKKQSGENTSSLEPLLQALHAAIGVPVGTPDGPRMLPLRHAQLLPIIAELRRRNAHDDVVSSVIRAFPLGESLLRLGVDRLWEKGLTGKGVKIALIDNGVDFGHPDFYDVENPINENLTRDRGVHTKGGHGTPMASILHAIAPDAEIQSYQALSNTQGLPGVSLSPEETNAALIKAMDRARANGAQIISMSLGQAMGYANDAFAKKIAELTKEGIVFVVSAGNEGYDLPNGYQVGSPATSPDAIAVGAVNYHGEIHGNREAFGSQGLVFNPDDNTVAEKPEIWAYGVNIKAAAQLPAPLYAEEPVPYQSVSGTSPAAPHVSAVVALMLQAAREAGRTVAKPAITGLVRRALVASAERIDRHPVMNSAEKAIEAYLAATAPSPSGS